MNFVFLAPGWLALAVVAPIAWFTSRRRGRPALGLLRAFVALLLAVGLARPAAWRADERERAVFVLDLSDSVAPGSREHAIASVAKLVRGLPGDVDAELVAIDAGERASDGGSALDRLGGFERTRHVARDTAGTGGSPISAALSAAARAIPIGSRGSVTLISDGLATDRRFGDAIVDLEERGIPLHVVPLAAAPHDARPAGLTAARELRVGQSATLTIDLVGTSDGATVKLLGPDGEIGVREDVACAGRAHVDFEFEPRAAGFVTIEARVESRDTSRAESGAEHSIKRTFAVQSPLEVLYVGGRMAHGEERLGELLGPGFVLHPSPSESVSASDAAPAPTAIDLGRYDLAVIDDAPASALADGFQRELATAVRERGLGLFACGGESAFGPGGWADSPLADILPVDCVQKEEKRDPSTTLVLIIDTSGSMGGERIQLAKEVARLAMSRLLPHDKVGIVEFYGAKRWAAPIQPASNTIELARAINRMDAGGGTVILPAIEEAFYGMQNVHTRYKHVLVLTDGGVENGAFEPLLRRMADEGMAVSTVLIGPEANSEFLVDIANWGKGRFYSVPDRFNLPEILLKQPTSSRLPAYQPGDFAVAARGGSGWWTSIERADIAHVRGYVETEARPSAEVLLEIESTRHPLLATWNVGLGRVSAFMTEPTGPGTATWNSWKDWGRLLARVVTRGADSERARFAFDVERRGAEVFVLATARHAGDDAPDVAVLDAAGKPGASVPFQARADGRFRARIVADPARELRFEARAAGVATDPVQFLVANARADEFDELAVDAGTGIDLARAARATGGDLVLPAALAEARPRSGGVNTARALLELAPFAYAAALGLWLLEIFLRRRAPRASS